MRSPPLLRKDIDAFFAWHRAQELPLYTERLKQWQTMATQDTTADQSCQQFDILRAAYQRSVERSIEPFARLALSLQPDQFQHLARHHAKSNQKFADEWLDDGEEARRSRLFDKALDRYETLYGDLSPAQRMRCKRAPRPVVSIHSAFKPSANAAKPTC